MNKYLEKIAEEKKDNHLVRDSAIGAVGASMAAGSADKILGYHTVYHGTSKDTATKIKREGFDPKMGGTGAASLRESTAKQSAGKVHVTKNKLLAHLYGSKIMHRGAAAMSGIDAGYDNSARSIWNDFKNAEVLKARIPHASWKGFDADPDHEYGARADPKNETYKSTAATTKKKISSKFVAGGEGSKGAFAFAHKNHLKNYYRSAEGSVRGMKGIGQAIAGAGMVGISLHNLVKSNGK